MADSDDMYNCRGAQQKGRGSVLTCGLQGLCDRSRGSGAERPRSRSMEMSGEGLDRLYGIWMDSRVLLW